MVDIYLVIANGSAGKSATVRALTGARTFGPFPVDMGFPRSVTRCFIEIRSVQESGRYMTVAKLIQAIKQSKCPAAVLAMRLDSYNGCKDAQSYIDALTSQGWPIKGACEITQTTFGLNYHTATQPVLVPPQDISGTANLRAEALRKAWPIS